jgi:hypothetical protein
VTSLTEISSQRLLGHAGSALKARVARGGPGGRGGYFSPLRGLEKLDISILSDKFLAEVRDMPQRNRADVRSKSSCSSFRPLRAILSNSSRSRSELIWVGGRYCAATASGKLFLPRCTATMTIPAVSRIVSLTSFLGRIAGYG